jgi:hypothetical protein
VAADFRRPLGGAAADFRRRSEMAAADFRLIRGRAGCNHAAAVVILLPPFAGCRGLFLSTSRPYKAQ